MSSSYRPKSGMPSGSAKNTPSSGSSQQQLIFGAHGIDITKDLTGVPNELLAMPCTKIFIEFMKLELDGLSVEQQNRASNHASIKIDFGHNYDRYYSVRVSVVVDQTSKSSDSSNGTSRITPGNFFLRPYPYVAQSNGTARTIELQLLQQNIQLQRLLEAIMNPGVHRFWFVNKNGRYYGCRDFVTQALYRLCQDGYASPLIIRSLPPGSPQLSINNAYIALGMRFTSNPVGHGYASPIDRGYFDGYRRVEDPSYMPYEDTQAAQDIANYLSQ